MGKNFWALLGIAVITFIGFLWIRSGDGPAATSIPASGTPSAQHTIGKQDAAVRLVEYSDFQCPACGIYYPIVEQLVAKYKDRVSFTYRHYPLTTIHPNAFAAARASEAAGKQDKFWEMYRLLFENQEAWADARNPQAIFESYAQQLGLNVGRYKMDAGSSETNDAINASIIEFNQRGLQKSTPTFLLNDKKIQPKDAADFSRLIEEQLKVAGQ